MSLSRLLKTLVVCRIALWKPLSLKFGAIIPSHVQCCQWQTWCQSDTRSSANYIFFFPWKIVGWTNVSKCGSGFSVFSCTICLIQTVSDGTPVQPHFPTPYWLHLNLQVPKILSGANSAGVLICCFSNQPQPSRLLRLKCGETVPVIFIWVYTCFIPSLSSWLRFWGEKTEINVIDPPA